LQLNAYGVGELTAIVAENDVNLVWNGYDEVQLELLGDGGCCPIVEFDMGKLSGLVDGNEEMKPAFCGSHFGNVDMEAADVKGFEVFP
jgi:hypothetical protein